LDFNGRPIVKMRDLPRLVVETAVGEHVKVKVLRGDDELTLDVTLGRLEDGEKLMAAAQQEAFPDDLSDVQAPGIREILGLEVEVVDDEAREAFDIAETTRGLVVTDVVAGSDAE